MRAFASKYMFDGSCLHENAAVLVENGLIADILPISKVSSPQKINYLGDGVITPGFIDLQLNGCGEVLFNDKISVGTLEVMHQTWLKYGTTSFLPTLITSDFKDVVAALRVIQDWFGRFGNRRGVLGIHLEGPFISKVRRGIHQEQFILPPTMDLLYQIVEFRKYFPIKMTIAVEQFTQEQIQFLVANKIILAVGHSDANYMTVQNAINLGVTAATHTFNAMSGLSARNPGVIGAILNNDIYSGLIVDMLHVDGANVRLLNKIKPNKVYLVTDAVTPTGTNLQQFEFAGKTLVVKDGKCIDEDGILGGACLTMNIAVRNCVEQCDLNLSDSLAMASLIPAQVLGLNDVLGRIAVGYLADLIYLDLHSYACSILSKAAT